MTKKKTKKKPVDCLNQGSLETSFYVVCSDKMILDNINHLMRSRGYMGVSDMTGRMHYMVDARKNVYSAVHHIIQEVTEKESIPVVTNVQMNEEIKDLFGFYKIDLRLIGGRLLRDILFLSIKTPTTLNHVTKTLYPLVGKRSGLSLLQVERDLRYVLRKSILEELGYRNVSAIRFLHDQLVEQLTKESTTQKFDTLA